MHHRHTVRPLVAALVLATATAGCSTTRESPVDGLTPASSVPAPTVKELGWTSAQAPVSRDITVLRADQPVGGGDRPGGPVLRAHLDPGQLYGHGNDATSRAEVYGRNASPWSTPSAQWPDPPGSVRWFRFAIYLPRDFPTSESSSDWLVLTQWKGRDGGSPPVSVEVARDRLRLGGERSNAGLVPDGGDLGPLPLGTWTSLVVGIGFSAGDDGWLEVRRDGDVLIPRMALRTMDVVDGEVDPVYLKQGIYRSRGWDESQTAYFSTVQVTAEEPTP